MVVHGMQNCPQWYSDKKLMIHFFVLFLRLFNQYGKNYKWNFNEKVFCCGIFKPFCDHKYKPALLGVVGTYKYY
jgi:hypothetical protein